MNVFPPPRKPRSANVTDTQVAAMYACYQAGMSASEVADQFGVCQRTVLAHFHRLGLPVRRRGPRSRREAA